MALIIEGLLVTNKMRKIGMSLKNFKKENLNSVLEELRNVDFDAPLRKSSREHKSTSRTHSFYLVV